jgi:hypothetical protein
MPETEHQTTCLPEPPMIVNRDGSHQGFGRRLNTAFVSCPAKFYMNVRSVACDGERVDAHGELEMMEGAMVARSRARSGATNG